jgi:2'-5' RNA ligase
MRLFLSIELQDGVRKHIAGMCRDWKEAWYDYQDSRDVSWVRPQNLHVTLKFLGEVADNDVPALCAALKTVESPGPASLVPERVECFPDRGPVRVITLAMGGDEGRLVLLHGKIEERCEPLGHEPERRRYRPHITLARCRRPLPPHKRAKLIGEGNRRLPGPLFEAKEFVLVESRLKPDGAEYLPLARFPLT